MTKYAIAMPSKPKNITNNRSGLADKTIALFGLLCIATALLAACGQPGPTPTDTPTLIPTNTSTPTPTLTKTPTPTPMLDLRDENAMQERGALRAEALAVREREIGVIESRYPHVENADELPTLSPQMIADYVRVAFNEYRDHNKHLYEPGADVHVYEDVQLAKLALWNSPQAAERNAQRGSLIEQSIMDVPVSWGPAYPNITAYPLAVFHHQVREYEWIKKYSRSRATSWHEDERSSARSIVGTALELLSGVYSPDQDLPEVRLLTRYIGVGVAETRDDVLGTDAWYVTILLSPCSARRRVSHRILENSESRDSPA